MVLKVWSSKEQLQQPWELVRNSHSPSQPYWMRSSVVDIRDVLMKPRGFGGILPHAKVWEPLPRAAWSYWKAQNTLLPIVFWAIGLPAWFLISLLIPFLEWEAHLFPYPFSRVLMPSRTLGKPSCPRTRPQPYAPSLFCLKVGKCPSPSLSSSSNPPNQGTVSA